MRKFQRHIDGNLITKIMDNVVKDLGFKKRKILHLQVSKFLSYEDFKLLTQVKYETISSLPTEFITKLKKNKFDLIFGDLPFGVMPFKGVLRNKENPHIKILNSLNKNGIYAALMPGYYRTFKMRNGQLFLESLKSKGFKVLSVLKLPDYFLRPHTNIPTVLVFIMNDNGVEESHFAAFKDSSFPDIQASITSWRMSLIYDQEKRNTFIENNIDLPHQEEDLHKKYDPELHDGTEFKISDFMGFDHWQESRQIEKLDTEYGGYKFVTLSELASVRTTKDKFENNKNAIYIPAIGTMDVIDNMPTKKSKKKPQNYFQVIVKDKRLKKDYLLNYLNSELGQKYLKLELSKIESFIPRLRKSDILALEIPLPNLGLQDEIIHNINKLHKVKKQLLDIEKSISTKPISSTEQLNRLDQIYKSSIELSESEIVFDEILKGESTSREFKETFALDIKSKKRGDHIVFACVKTIAGFLNANGGTLFIGVADNSDIKGIEAEVGTRKLFKSLDKYQLAIKDTLKRRISTSSLNNINFKLIKIRGKNILRIECDQSDHQIFIDNKDTYLRVGPSTELLEGPDLVNFAKERFN